MVSSEFVKVLEGQAEVEISKLERITEKPMKFT